MDKRLVECRVYSSAACGLSKAPLKTVTPGRGVCRTYDRPSSGNRIVRGPRTSQKKRTFPDTLPRRAFSQQQQEHQHQHPEVSITNSFPTVDSLIRTKGGVWRIRPYQKSDFADLVQLQTSSFFQPPGLAPLRGLALQSFRAEVLDGVRKKEMYSDPSTFQMLVAEDLTQAIEALESQPGFSLSALASGQKDGIPSSFSQTVSTDPAQTPIHSPSLNPGPRSTLGSHLFNTAAAALRTASSLSTSLSSLSTSPTSVQDSFKSTPRIHNHLGQSQDRVCSQEEGQDGSAGGCTQSTGSVVLQPAWAGSTGCGEALEPAWSMGSTGSEGLGLAWAGNTGRIVSRETSYIPSSFTSLFTSVSSSSFSFPSSSSSSSSSTSTSSAHFSSPYQRSQHQLEDALSFAFSSITLSLNNSLPGLFTGTREHSSGTRSSNQPPRPPDIQTVSEKEEDGNITADGGEERDHGTATYGISKSESHMNGNSSDSSSHISRSSSRSISILSSSSSSSSRSSSRSSSERGNSIPHEPWELHHHLPWLAPLAQALSNLNIVPPSSSTCLSYIIASSTTNNNTAEYYEDSTSNPQWLLPVSNQNSISVKTSFNERGSTLQSRSTGQQQVLSSTGIRSGGSAGSGTGGSTGGLGKRSASDLECWSVVDGGIPIQGPVVGTVEVTIMDEEEVIIHLKDKGARQYSYISTMAVNTGVRRKGLAQALLCAAEQQTLLWGHHHLALHVYQDNKPAVQLYSKYGLDCIATDPAWKKLLGGRVRLLMYTDLNECSSALP